MNKLALIIVLMANVVNAAPIITGGGSSSGGGTAGALTNYDDRDIVFSQNLSVLGSIAGRGDAITNGAGYSVGSMADTNWVLSQIASLGAHVYATGVTNTDGVLTFTNKSQGWASVPTTVVTNVVSAAAGQYVRSIVSTNTFSRFEAGPIDISVYVSRTGTAATSISFHPEIYIFDPVLSNLVEIAAAPPQVCQSNIPVMLEFSVSIPTSFVPTNASHIVWSWKIDSTNGTPTSLNFVSGGAYDSHLSFSVPASAGFTLPSTVPLTNIANTFYSSNIFNGITYFSELRSAYPGGNIGIGSNSAQVASAGLLNVAIGSSALSKNTNGSYNVALGALALGLATNASSSSAVGYGAQYRLQSGSANTAVGYFSQANLITGTENTAVGNLAQANMTGSKNTAVGNTAQNGNLSGSQNTAVGDLSQIVLTSGSDNASIGFASLYSLKTGIRNMAVGTSSLGYELAGNDNTAIGYSALGWQTNGSGMVGIGINAGTGPNAASDLSSMRDTNCTFIGTSSGRSPTIPNTTPLTNATSIGYNAKAIANNTVTLGGTLKEAVALVINPMSVQPTNIAIGNPYIYSRTNASVAELFAVGGDGVETQISPHADDAPPQLYDKTTGDMKEIIWRESNPYITNGLVSFINLRRMARTMELQTRVLLLLGGVTNASTTAAMARLKAMTVAEKQVLMTEDYPTYNARTGNNLQPLDWDTIQNGVQATYDMQRANVDLQRTYLSATNAVIQAQIDAGDTNVTLVELPAALPVKNVRQPKPSWMQ